MNIFIHISTDNVLPLKCVCMFTRTLWLTLQTVWRISGEGHAVRGRFDLCWVVMGNKRLGGQPKSFILKHR